MKRVTLILLMLLLSLPVFAQTKPLPFGVGDEQYEFAGNVAKNDATHMWNTQVSFNWFHVITPKQMVGATVGYLNGTVNGESAGATYRWYLARLKYGALFLGGDSSALSGDASDLAAATAATQMGYQLFVGKTAAVTFSGRIQHAVNPATAGSGEPLNQKAFLIGISLFKPQAVPVQ